MKTELTATVVNGMLKPDQPLSLADNTRVRLTLEATDTWQRDLREGVAGLKQLIDERPIGSGGLRYTRDELHERD